MWRLIYFMPIWALFLLLRTIMIMLGWILVPLAAALKAYEAYMGTDGVGTPRVQYKWTWSLMWPWDNKEDGIADTTYPQSQWFDSMLWKIFYWSALRNPANNLRYIPFLSVNIEKEKVKYIGSLNDKLVDPRVYDRDDLTFWYVCWQGLYSNFRIHFKMFNKVWRFWIGWKIYPEDSIWDVTGHRAESAGFATQFKRIWPK